MAIGIRIKLAGITEEQFDAVNKHVDPAGDPARGLLFHASGPIDEGWGVIDFWESRQHFDAFEPPAPSCKGPRTSSSSRFTRPSRVSARAVAT